MSTAPDTRPDTLLDVKDAGGYGTGYFDAVNGRPYDEGRAGHREAAWRRAYSRGYARGANQRVLGDTTGPRTYEVLITYEDQASRTFTTGSADQIAVLLRTVPRGTRIEGVVQ